MMSVEVYRRRVSEEKSCWMRVAMAGSAKATVTAVGCAWATSRAKLGPLKAPMGRTRSSNVSGAGAMPEELTCGASSSVKTSRLVS